MSYCRWSTDDYQCDVYVYEDVAGGFTTHVATNRPVYKKDLPPKISDIAENFDAFFKRQGIIHDMLENAERKAIGLPHDGETFNDDTAIECAIRLEHLKSIGYNVPQSAIDALRSEANNEKI